MASVFPSVRPLVSDRVSQAERDVLDVLASLPSEWCIIHSLWLKTHNVKLHAEADFIVITDKAVIILEVKGGNVWRDDAGWHFMPKYGGTDNIKHQGPFDQARGAYYALREHLYKNRRSELFDDHIWGYGVVCPECALNVSEEDAFISPRILLDERRFPLEMKTFIDDLASYWHTRYLKCDISGVKSSKSRTASIGSIRRAEIVKSLRPSFEIVIGPGESSIHAERDLLSLTSQQLAALDFISMEPRNLLVGSAGTGKTILAVEQAMRQAAKGKKVLMLCFNKLLAIRLSARFSKYSHQQITVGNYHQVVLALCKSKGITHPISETWDVFRNALKDTLEELLLSLSDEDYFDYLIIDEAQDLMSHEFMDFIDLILRGGLKYGSWMMACDLQQAIFRGSFDQALIDKLVSWSRKTPLMVNCRNTKQIAAYVTGISGVGNPITRGVVGEMPIIRYYDSQQKYLQLLKKLVNELIKSFVDAKLQLSEIVILYGKSEYVPEEVLKPGFFLRNVKDAASLDPSQTDIVQISSIQGFKGLEAKAVVLVGIDDLSSKAWRDLFYVGASRAKTNLRIILPEACPEIKVVLSSVLDLLMKQEDEATALQIMSV
jgi:hypothetical protein